MGADIKTLRTRIKSVNSTLHLTKAMGLVASSKIHKANERMQKSREYATNLETILSVLTASRESLESSFMRTGGNRVRLIVIAGDRGLAGGYNANIFRLVDQFSNAEIISIGYCACDRFGGVRISAEHFQAEDAIILSKQLCEDFVENKYDKLGIVCTKYISVMTQETLVKWLFPLKMETKNSFISTVFEPDVATVLNCAIPEYIAGTIIASVRESFACEIVARRMAMDNAEKNAQQMTEDLRMEYNRARQGAITQEISEIVAGNGA